jgi:membrane-associated phospholipid phosphatase
MYSRIVVGLMFLSVANYAAGQSQPQSTPEPPGNDVSASTERPVSLRLLLPNTASDQKRIWLFPWDVIHGRNWKPALVVTAVTAALVALDPVDTPYFRRTSNFGDFNNIFSGSHTSLFIAAVPAAFYLTGLVKKNSYAQKTALLAGEAVVNSEILMLVMKTADRRIRPVAIAKNGNLSDTWFDDRSVAGAGSFPSGHTIAAFSVATVFARRYNRHRWAPYVAYGLAGVIGFSRISLLAHFPSDVFMGAALGYSISRFVVLR